MSRGEGTKKKRLTGESGRRKERKRAGVGVEMLRLLTIEVLRSRRRARGTTPRLS